MNGGKLVMNGGKLVMNEKEKRSWYRKNASAV